MATVVPPQQAQVTTTLFKQPSVGLRAPSKPPQTIDDLIQQRAREPGCDDPILAYPVSAASFDYYTPRQLNSLAEDAARYYATFLPLRRSSDDPVLVVGLLGASTFEYLLTLLAINKLGHTVLFLSTRISEEAHVSLLTRTKASALLIDDSFRSMAEAVQPQVPGLQVGSIGTKADFDHASAQAAELKYSRDSSRETGNIAWIIHSSGSTGLPKPIFQTQTAAVQNYAVNFNLKGFITLPLFHAHGISCVFRSIYSKKMIYMYSANLPLTSGHLISTLRDHEIGILYGVPYALKLLAETEEGLKLLAKLEIVMFGGSACPKPIGDKLVSHGVRLVSHYGSTETGQLMTSFRPRDDLDWDYVRPSDSLKPYLLWEERYPGIFELIVREGWPSKVMTNREDGGYATKDLFEKHPTKPDAWRYYARLDDTITLVNGEKANPLLVEGVAREHRYVRDAVAFGTGKTKVGLFIVAATDEVSGNEITEAIWPAIEKTNTSVPAYARLSKDMIKVLSPETEYRRTDKGTVIRAAFYKDFASQIEEAYEDQTGSIILSASELLNFLHKEITDILALRNPEALKPDVDVFSLGMDSLQAAQVRRAIVSQLSTGNQRLGQNFAFDYPNLNAMAQEILRLQAGEEKQLQLSVEERMQNMIEKYSTFHQHTPVDNSNEGQYILVTGATGSLGAHMVAQLASLDSVSRVYCLVRAPSLAAARARVRVSMQERCVYHTLSARARNKIHSYPSNFAEGTLGLEAAIYDSIASNLTGVIHSAWAVNFNMGLESFERDCVAGVHNLINLCLRAKRPAPASFNFCSSVSAVAGTPGGVAIEALPVSLSHAQNMGYAKSKLVSEHICMQATAQAGIEARVLRIGQVIADTKHGVWNATEAIPLMLQTAKTIGALPALDERPAWLPVDVVARSSIDIALSNADGRVFNIVNRNRFHWTNDLLPLLRQAGLEFEELPQRAWIQRLRNSNTDPISNPPIKLLEFFAGKYDSDESRPGLDYETKAARKYAPSLDAAQSIDGASVSAFVKQFSNNSWAANSRDSTKSVIVLCGPCGAGKSTAAEHVAEKYGLPRIEGDDLHTSAAIEKMGSGNPLTDDKRWAWLQKIRATVVHQLHNENYSGVVVTCSALNQALRNDLRLLNIGWGAKVHFILLHPGNDNSENNAGLLKNRLHDRQGHYMKEDMVDAQLQACKLPSEDEIDITPVDISGSREEILEEVVSIIKDIIKGE